jgi:tRNA(Arg) A34 adenosine deaminase TadA
MNYAFHEHFMRMALREADKAAAAGEVPTGCVIIADPGEAPACLAAVRVLGRAHNQTEMLKDPTAHAEMLAITQAAAALGDFRLTGTILYVTKEPCAMCAGAIVLARIPTVSSTMQRSSTAPRWYRAFWPTHASNASRASSASAAKRRESRRLKTLYRGYSPASNLFRK